MNEQELLDTFATIVTDDFAVPADEYGPDIEFEAMGLDSLDLVELTLVLEDETGVTISDEELEDVLTPRDAVQAVIDQQRVEA